ncbi:MAG: fimbrillin family protein [Tidjanibacter sp.]|nr:fimbrillin family protein [Tidjanibacter sp.]
MKKLFAIAAVVAVALTSCVKNEVIEPAGEITFKNFALSENTRAEAFSTDKTFECFAIYEGEDGSRRHFWASGAAETIAYDGTNWANVEGKYYWPKDGNLDFYAYYTDKDIHSKIVGNTTEALGMTIANLTIDEAQGLLIADPAKDLDRNDVPIIFRHTTSRLGFYFANANVNGANSFHLTINSIEVDQLNKFANYNETDKWTANTPEDKQILAANYIVTDESIVAGTTKAAAQVELFPQAETVITIKYTVVDNNNFKYTGTYVINPTDTAWATEANKWIANNDYHYNLTFYFKAHDDNGDGDTNDPGEDYEIHFVPTVEEWTVQTHEIYDERQ